MKRMLFNATYQEELRVALVEGQKLINFDIETTSKAQRRGNIYCGVVTRVESSLEACFVDYGTEKQGFLPFKEINFSQLTDLVKSRDYPKITEGTKVIVQVEKDERGNKGAALTTYISLPGRYLVLMPNSSRSGGISRRIEGEERDELKSVLSQLSVPSGMSVIARTAALGRVSEELQWDLNYLLKLWDAIKNAAEVHNKFLIYQESNLVIRSIRDHFSKDVAEILIDKESIYNEARNFMASIMPNYVDKIKFYHDDVQLFSRFQVEHQIESAYSRTVNLPSGGVIVIDHTEALTAIDVNSAKANKGMDIEETALATNLEATEEIARQIRLRDLGGLIVVDFIDMENIKNQREVENWFKQQLSFDRARIQMGKLSKFGLLELSRQRLQASLEESTTISCPRCLGIGVIRGTESIAVHILRIIQEEAVKSGSYIAALYVQVPVEVATYLLNEKREDISKIEHRMRVRVVLIPNIHLESPNYKIKKITNDNYDYVSQKQSFTFVDNSFEEISTFYSEGKKKVNVQVQKAVVSGITPSQPAPVIISKSLLVGMLGGLLNWVKNLFCADKKKAVPSNIKKAFLKSPAARVDNKVVRGTQSQNPVRAGALNNQNSKPNKPKPYGSSVAIPPQNKNLQNESSARSRDNQNQLKENVGSNRVINNKVNLGKERLPRDQVVNSVNTAAAPQIMVKKDNKVDSSSTKQQSTTGSLLSANREKNGSDNKVKNVVEHKEEKRIEVRNTILDPVELGELKLVSTNQGLANDFSNQNSSAVKNVKRYNDTFTVVEGEIGSDIQYELVETKRSL